MKLILMVWQRPHMVENVNAGDMVWLAMNWKTADVADIDNYFRHRLIPLEGYKPSNNIIGFLEND